MQDKIYNYISTAMLPTPTKMEIFKMSERKEGEHGLNVFYKVFVILF